MSKMPPVVANVNLSVASFIMTSRFFNHSAEKKGNPMKSANGRLATSSQRILVVDNRSIFGAGVEQLLSNTNTQQHLQIAGIVPQDELELIREVWRYSPDVIILSNQSQVTNPIKLISLLKDYQRFRLIVVSETDNTIEVYEKRHIVAKQQTDLLAVVQSD